MFQSDFRFLTDALHRSNTRHLRFSASGESAPRARNCRQNVRHKTFPGQALLYGSRRAQQRRLVAARSASSTGCSRGENLAFAAWSPGKGRYSIGTLADRSPPGTDKNAKSALLPGGMIG